LITSLPRILFGLLRMTASYESVITAVAGIDSDKLTWLLALP
jgi:hypothetical protein